MMKQFRSSPFGVPNVPPTVRSASALADLAARVYEYAPLFERSRMLEQLLRPLGPAALADVAGGVFSRMKYRQLGNSFRVTLTDAQAIEAHQLVALVLHVDRLAPQAVDSLAEPLRASPIIRLYASTVALLEALDHRRAVRDGAARVAAAGTGATTARHRLPGPTDGAR